MSLENGFGFSFSGRRILSAIHITYIFHHSFPYKMALFLNEAFIFLINHVIIAFLLLPFVCCSFLLLHLKASHSSFVPALAFLQLSEL